MRYEMNIVPFTGNLLRLILFLLLLLYLGLGCLPVGRGHLLVLGPFRWSHLLPELAALLSDLGNTDAGVLCQQLGPGLLGETHVGRLGSLRSPRTWPLPFFLVGLLLHHRLFLSDLLLQHLLFLGSLLLFPFLFVKLLLLL